MNWPAWIAGCVATALVGLPAQSTAPATAPATVPATVTPTASQARQLFEQGQYEAAAAAWRQLAAESPEQSERQYNLALASWRAGQLDAARDAIEKYAALARSPRVDLHRGLLGAIAHDEAKALAAAADADPAQTLPQLQAALAKAGAAREHFVRGALAGGGAELRRNAERAQRLAGELQQRIDELKQAQDQQQEKSQPGSDQQQDPDQQPQAGEPGSGAQDPQPGESQPGESQEGQPQQSQSEQSQSEPGQAPQGESQPGESPPNEPPAGEGTPPEAPPPTSPQTAPEGQGETPPSAAEPAPLRDDELRGPPPPAEAGAQNVPGEAPSGRQLSPEQQKRLLDMLQQLDHRQQALQARWKAQRPKVEKDW